MERATTIDLNSDLGEGYGAWSMGDDEAMLALVTSANIACGFHAGDPTIMRTTVRHAVERGVTIGAHVAYHDRRGFGRRDIDVNRETLADDVAYQIGALGGIATSEGARVRYVKPHGALYNKMAKDPETAGTVCNAIARIDRGLALMALPATSAEKAALEAGLQVVAEGFADRAYQDDGTLLPRTQPGAVIDDEAVAGAQAVMLARDHSVRSSSGTKLPLNVRSICVHGDTKGAVRLARAIRQALESAGVVVRPFLSPP